jgi:hypothetical protein
MNLRSFVAVVCAGAFMGSAFGAGGSGFGSGIADVARAERQTARKVKMGASDRVGGGATVSTDPDGRTPPVTQSGPAVATCNFSGFPDRDLINGAYAGGSSQAGIQQTNLGVSFSGATVLNAWNGSGSPDAGVAYAPTGQMTFRADSTSFGWEAIEFWYCSRTNLRVDAFASTDATGAAIQSFDIAANITAAPFSTWTSRKLSFSQAVKSIRISGSGNLWGIDALTAFAGSPECTFGDYVNLSFNSPVESANTTISGYAAYTGTIIRYRNVATVGGKAVDARVSVASVAGAIRWDGHLIALRGNDHGVYYSSTAISNTGSFDCKIEFFEGGGSFTSPIWIPKFRLAVYDLDGSSGTQTERVSVSIPIGQAGFFGYQTDPWVSASSAPGLLTFTGIGTDFPENGNAAVILHFAGSKEVTMRMSQSKSAGSTVDPVLNGIDGDLGSIGDLARFSPITNVRTPPADCDQNGLVDSCEIALGTATDCNNNGVPDSCDLSAGTSVDQNGNGVPDSCDPFPTLTLLTNAASCNAVGSFVDVDARLSGVLNLVVAGQVVLDWDPSKLELVSSSAGDPPYVSNYLLNNAAGTAVILVSAEPGGGGTSAASAIVSRMRFKVLGGSCDGSGTGIGFGEFGGTLSTEFTDGFGSRTVPTLVDASGFVVDDGAPVLSNVPANVSVQAFAGEGGSALVTLGTPTATDACAPSLTATGVRSDGQGLGAAWPSGTTTVTWSATDPCGNTTTATTSVTVDPTNTLDLAVNVGYGYYGAPRTLSLAVLGSTGTQTRSASVSVMWDGSATFSVTDLPVDNYDCVTIEDTARSLRARVSISDTGSVWSAAATNLIQGDVINDEVIDVLDWGAYIVRNANADFNGDGLLNSLDGDVILANFGKRGDSACGAGSPERAAITAISVSDLVAMGMPELAGADLNGDGMLDAADMEFAGN